MSLIKSISGIRGTIGGAAGDGLSPLDIVKFTSAYATFIRRTTKVDSNKIVVGRDARLSGNMVLNVVVGTLEGMGFDVVNIGLATTPTTELAVTWENACGGIIITASHNPKQWNALKLLNEKGEFLTDAEGKEVLRIAEAEDFNYAEVDNLGHETKADYLDRHIQAVLDLNLVDVDAIKKANFTVAVDAVNSIGGVAIPKLLEALGVKKVEKLYLQNPNLAYALSATPPDVGSVRETLFLAWLKPFLSVTSSPISDFEVEGRTFAVGGKNKGRRQLQDAAEGYVVKDDIEYAFRQTIPLWHFGFLY